MDFSRWFQSWLMRHPLNVPPDDRTGPYTADVMRRVHALAEPARQRRLVRPLWRGWITLTAGLATAAAGLIAVLTLTPRAQMHLAQPLPSASGHLMRLADASGEESWVEQTMQLLDALNEDAPADAADDADPANDDDWLKELDTLEPDDRTSAS